MQNMENVYVQDNSTEQGSKIEVMDKSGSADLGKFKDVNALMQAYQSLQAEFTRRSQRLKRYEEQENQKSNTNDTVTSLSQNSRVSARAEKLGGKALGAMEMGAKEQLGENLSEATVIDAQEILSESGDKLDEVGLVKGCAMEGGFEKELEEKADASDVNSVSRVVGADAHVTTTEGPCSSMEEKISAKNGDGVSATAATVNQAEYDAAKSEWEIPAGSVEEQSAENLYKLAAANEQVRLRIVGDYLSSIGKSNAPLIKGGVGALATPPKKPRNLADAGNMALAYLKAYKLD